MRVLFSAMLCLALAGGAEAQRRGGGMMGGGGRMGGGHGLNGGFNGGGFRGGHGGFGSGIGGFGSGIGGFGGYRGGIGGYRGGLGGFRDGFGGYRNSYYSNWGFGLGLGWGWGWPGYYAGYSYPYYGGYYDGFYPYDTYAASPAVTVVYAPQPTPPVYVAAEPERAHPVTHEYDQYGQEVRGGGSVSSPARASSPIYLFAFQDHLIRAANAYWIEGKTLHYVTLQHEEKQAPVETLDRALTLQLNRERQVAIDLR